MSDLPPIPTTLMPPDVRAAGPKAQAVYAAGLAFEQQLIQQMTTSLSSLVSSDGDDGDGDDDGSADAASSQIASMLPQALAQGVTDDGGLGLAAELTRPYLEGQS